MTFLLERLWVFALAAILLGGCSKSGPTTSFDAKAFDSAPPAVKQVWDDAMAASANNDPGQAISILRILSRQQISQEQQKTLFDAIVANEAKLRENAKKGDPTAVKAMETLGYH